MTAATTLRARDERYIGPLGLERRRTLLAGLRALLESTPWRAVTVKSIAERAGCLPGAFWQYFASIEDAFDVMFAQVVEEECPVPVHLALIWELLGFERNAMREETT